MNAWARCARRVVVALCLVPSLAWAADPQIASWIDDPDPVSAGGTFTYTLRVDNNASDAATNTQLRVTVPSGATFISATPASQNCVATTPTQIDCNLGTLGGNGADVRTIVMTWRATGPGGTVINATALLSADSDSNSANNTQSQTTTVNDGANLSLTMTDAPDPVVGGGNLTWTLTAANAGPSAGGNLVVTSNLPPSTSFVSATGSGWTCSHASGVVTCSRSGPHAAGAAIPAISIVARVTAPGGTLTHSATISPGSGAPSDPDLNDNTATADTVVQSGADVRIAGKTVTSTSPAMASTNVSFRTQPRNDGPVAASNAVVTEVLPAGWTFVSAAGSNWSCSAAGQTITCTRATLPVGATDDIDIVATSPASGAVGAGGTTYAHTATITSSTQDANGANNSGSANITVLPDGADLRIDKFKTPDPVAQGANLTSTITVTNNGPSQATGPLRVIDVLTGESYVSFSGTGWTCTPTGNVVVCDHANASGVAVNAALPVLNIVTTATAVGTVTNVACTGSSVPTGVIGFSASPPVQGDPNTANDCATSNANATGAQPDLAMSVTTSTPTGADKTVSTSESSVTYTLVVTNASAGAQSATGVRFTDTLPGYISGRTTLGALTPVVSGGTATFSCSAAGATVTCTQTGGVLAQGETVSLPITMNRPLLEGSFTNSAYVTNTAQGDPNAANNSGSDTVVIQAIADVEMTGKTATPSTVRAGETSTYVLSFRNNGPSQAMNVVVTDTLSFAPGDAGLTVVSIVSSKAGSTCSIADGAQLTPAASSFTCTIGAMADGETQTITLVVRPNAQSGSATRTVNNTASVTTSSVENPAGGDNGNNLRSTSLSISASAIDLLVNTTDAVDPVAYVVGGTFLDYRVRVTNNGPSFGTGVRVTETMTPPAGRRVRFVCDTTAFGGATCNATSLCSATNLTSGAGVPLAAFSCSVPAGNSTTGAAIGELAVNQSKDIFLRFEVLDQPAALGDVFNVSSTVSANEPDGFAANDTQVEATTTRQRVDIRVTKNPSQASVSLRQPFNWVITVTNNGPGHALQTDLTDPLPAGTEVIGPITWTRSLQAASGTCTLAGQLMSCALGQLDSGGTATITVPVRISVYPSGGISSNTATVDTSPTKLGAIDTPGGNNVATSQVTVTRSSISGTVFEDRDRSGTNAGTPQASGTEPRIAGVSLRLTGTDAYGNAVDQTTTTDASGNYSFTSLSPASGSGYTVTQTQPATYANGPVDPPTSGGAAPTVGGSYSRGGAAGDSAYGAIVLGADTAAQNYHFPELRRVSISGFVYLDANGNSQRDAGSDADISGAIVRLLHATSGVELATATTDASGAYSFANLDPLTPYTLEQPLPASPAGLINGSVQAGLIGGAACASGCTAQPNTPAAGTDRIAGIDLSTGQDATRFNFGERLASPISGTVYLDRNRNGTLDAAPTDTPLPGVTLTLYAGSSCSGTAVASAVSDSNGNYSFGGLTVGGTFTVCETQPTAYADGGVNPGTNASSGAANSLTVTSLPASGSAGNHFAERAASIAGTVFLDADNNGLLDAGAESGIAGVALVLSGTDATGAPVNLSTTTDANGRFSFESLLAGTYAVTEPQQPSGTLNGTTRAGTAGGAATAVTVVPSRIDGIVLAVGQASTDNLFGEIPDGPDLRVSKRHLGSLFTVGQTATYLITVRNAGTRATSGAYTVEDRLPAGLSLAATPAGTGWACTGAAGSASFTCSSSAVLATGASSADITVLARVGAAAAAASPVNNVVLVDGGGEADLRRPTPAQRDAFTNRPDTLPLCTAAIAHEACRDPAPVQLASSVSGTVWTDNGSAPRVLDAADRRMAGWRVEVVDIATNTLVGTTTTAADGRYRVDDLVPGVPYGVRFRDPASNVVWGYPVNGETAPGSSGAACATGTVAPGAASSCVGTGDQPQLTVVLAPGVDLPQQSLPIDPSGVIYDSGTRATVPGAVVTLAPDGACAGWNPTTSVVGATMGGYAINGPAVSMTVGADGFYQFLFTPAAPASCSFALSVVPPQGYTFRSVAIPPQAGVLTPTGGTGSVLAVQPQATAPTGPVGSATTYYLRVLSGSAGANIIHNHIPVDPELPGAISLSKAGDKAQAEIGDTVRYTVTVTLQSGARPRQTTVVDRLPAGFTYIRGSATVDDRPIADPTGGLGPTLAFQLGSMPTSNRLVLRYRLRVNVGAAQGDGINRAQGHACGVPTGCVDAGFAPLRGSVATNTAQHRVQVSGGVFGTEACVLGKVFVDCNGNHVQDREELGIPGVRLMLSDLSFLVTDSEGKYSLCGLPARSHAIRIDPLTLPRGSRMTTSSNRNLGDAGSLWLDLKSGELHRADFIEGSCSNTVLEQVKARRAQGEVRAPETEKQGSPALRFDNKAHQLDTQRSPQQGTDGANQRAPKPRPTPPASTAPSRDESHVPTPDLPMNRPPPTGRSPGQAPDAPSASNGAQPQGGSDGQR